ncbi:MAG: sterol desaturase family protein [Schleiferiaceae bacterium]
METLWEISDNSFWKIIGGTALSFGFLALVFFPMERVFPAKAGQKFFRPQWGLDLTFFLGQYLLWSAWVTSAMYLFKVELTGWVPQDIRAFSGSLPFVVQVLIVLISSDFLIYWGHRLQHSVDFLWRFHKVHHSAQHMDWLAAHREHPLDSIYTIGLVNMPAFILGFPLDSILAIIAFRGIWAIYIHSNVRLPIGPLRYLIGAPELHHWHHDLDRRAGNYANISPLMDVLFGTYKCPDHEPEAFGIKEESPTTYVGQMVEPMVPKSWWRKMKKQPTPSQKKTANPQP